MIKIKYLLLPIYLLAFSGFAQEIVQQAESSQVKMYTVKDYPDGFYITIDDFIQKKRTPYPLLLKRTVRGMKPIAFDVDADQLFFITKSDSTKLSNVFAVSFRGSLYIEQKYFTKYAKKGNKNEEGSNPNSYHRVLKDGRFLYMEGVFFNAWKKGFAYGMGGAVGGAVASSMDELKAVVFDVDKKEFDFIKDCEDFNIFLTERQAAEKVDCKTYSIEKVREAIDKIIK